MNPPDSNFSAQGIADCDGNGFPPELVLFNSLEEQVQVRPLGSLRRQTPIFWVNTMA